MLPHHRAAKTGQWSEGPFERASLSRHDGMGSGEAMKNDLPNLNSKITLASLRGKTAGIAFPYDPRMFQHIHPVGMRKREGNVLLAQQNRDRRGLAQFFQRLRQLFENDRREPERGFVED